MAEAVVPRHVVCGLDELGFRCAEELTRLGEPVVVVTRQPETTFKHRLDQLGVPVVIGSYHDLDVLVEAGIGDAPSMIVTENDDAGNLHAALAAREVNPDIRVVLRIFNTALGRRVAEVFPGAEVLSSSVIAAPAFVSAALETDFEQRVDLDGRTLILRHANADDPDVLMPVALTGPDGSFEFFPPPTDGALCLAVAPPNEQARRTRGRTLAVVPRELRAAWRLVASLADIRLRYVLGVVGLIVVVSTAFFMVFAHYTWIDALYFVVTTITTIGYGDITTVSQSVPVRLFSIALELVGAAALAVFFAVITDALVGVRLRHALGGLQRDMDDHVIVVGIGNIGSRVVEELHKRRVPVLAMEADEAAKAVAEVRQQGIPVLIGDAREVSNFRRTSVETARCLVVTTDDDVANLEIALTGRSLHPDLKIVMQLHDPDLAARVQRSLGVGVSRSTAGIAAPAFVSAAIGHRVVSAIAVGDRMLVVARSTVAAGAEAEGRDLAWLQDGPYARVILLRRGEEQTWAPGPDTVLAAGDELAVVATRKGLDGLLRRTEAARAAVAS